MLWLFLVLACIEGTLTSPGFVLCFEPDGNVFIESSFSGLDCAGCPVPASDSRPSGQTVVDASECCPCIDVAFGASPDRSPAARNPQLLQLVWLATNAVEQPAAIEHEAHTPALPAFLSGPAADAPDLVGSVVLHV